MLLKLEPISDVLGKDFRCVGDDTVESDDEPLRNRIEQFSALPIADFFAVTDELEL